jgi:hypothetical protein
VGIARALGMCKVMNDAPRPQKLLASGNLRLQNVSDQYTCDQRYADAFVVGIRSSTVLVLQILEADNNQNAAPCRVYSFNLPIPNKA